MNAIPHRYLDVREVAEYYGVSVHYMRDIQRQKNPACIKDDRFPQHILDMFVTMTKRGNRYMVHGSTLAAFEAARIRRETGNQPRTEGGIYVR